MDINIFRSIVTVVFLLIFAGIVGWAYTKENAKSFEEAAKLPFEDDDETD